MTDDPEPKKSMREQVEEYKRKQREAEGKAQDFTGEDSDDSDPAWDSKEFENLEAKVRDGLASGPNVGRMVGSIFTVVGLLLLATSGTILYFTQQSMAAEVEAPGIVIRNELRQHERSSNSSSSSRGSTDLWHAVVEFKLADGAPKTVEMSAGNWPKAFDEGEAVTVRYDPAKPLKARIAGDFGMEYFPTIITGFLGFTFFVVGASVWRFLGRT
jgi:hypothetical protein